MRKVILTLGLASLLTAGYSNTKFNPDQSELTKCIINNRHSSEPDPFCKAIMQGDIETVKRMIDLGVEINKKSLGKTPAMYAARFNKPKILELLIRSGATLSIKSEEGFTAEKYAQLSHANEALTVINSSDK